MRSPENSRTAQRQLGGSKKAQTHLHSDYRANPDICQASGCNQTPIKPGLILHGGRSVASVEPDGALLRWAKPGELLRQPPSWAFHPDVLADAKARGATLVRVVLRDNGRKMVYETPLAEFDTHGIPINRGYGHQVALTLDHWQIDGKPSRVAQRAKGAKKGGGQGGDSGAPVQLSLFGEAGR